MPGQSQPSCVNLIFHRLEKVVAKVAVTVTVIAVFPLKSTNIVCPLLSPQRIGTTVLPPVTVTESVEHTPSPSGCASTKSRKSIRSCNLQNFIFCVDCFCLSHRVLVLQNLSVQNPHGLIIHAGSNSSS